MTDEMTLDELEDRLVANEHEIRNRAHCEDLEFLSRRLDKLQDANLAPLLESSALLVELRRIADALETLGTVVEPRHKPSDTPAYIRHREAF